MRGPLEVLYGRQTKDERQKDTNMDIIEGPAATPRQLDYIRGLVAQKYTPEEQAKYLEFLDAGVLKMSRASEIIDILKELPKINHNTQAYTPNEDVEVGLYRVDGVAYKVKRAVYGSGHLYACPWDEEAQGFGEKEVGAIRKIRASHRMTLEEAGPYGLAMSACAHCGRPLTDENSIALGLGPICAGKY